MNRLADIRRREAVGDLEPHSPDRGDLIDPPEGGRRMKREPDPIVLVLARIVRAVEAHERAKKKAA